jgi:hypothetical protein
VDGELKPLAQAVVEATRATAGTTSGTAATDAGGAFCFDLPAGRYFVTVTKAGYRATQAAADVPQEGDALRLMLGRA